MRVLLALVVTMTACGGAVSTSPEMDASLDAPPDTSLTTDARSDAPSTKCRPAGGLCFVRYCLYLWNPAPVVDEDCPGGSGEAGVCCVPGQGSTMYHCLAAGGECAIGDCRPGWTMAPDSDQDCPDDPGGGPCCLPPDAGTGGG